VFSKKIPTNEELNKFYNSYGINNYLSPLTIKRYNELLDKFEPYRKTNKLIDVGCGIGYFLDEAKKRGWEVYGTEFSGKSADICSAKGINIRKGILNADNYQAGMFDIITSFEVIEHINNPRTELKTFNSILREGGLVYVTTPNFNSLLRYRLKSAYNVITYPEHLCYYTPNTLNKLFGAFGFNGKFIETTGISLTRFRTSSGKSDQKIISAKSDDERIRNKVDNKWYLQLAKRTINKTLTFFGLGDSLKGWFIKRNNS
jgi:SAM-dependent methyltransferase